jgi:hypothetical protein
MTPSEMTASFGGELIDPDLRRLWELREMYLELAFAVETAARSASNVDARTGLQKLADHLFGQAWRLQGDITLCHSMEQVAAMSAEWKKTR